MAITMEAAMKLPCFMALHPDFEIKASTEFEANTKTGNITDRPRPMRNRAWRRKNTFHHNRRRIRRLQCVGYYTRETDKNQVFDLVNGHFSGHCFYTYGAMCRKEVQKDDYRREQRWILESSLEDLKDNFIEESFDLDDDFDDNLFDFDYFDFDDDFESSDDSDDNPFDFDYFNFDDDFEGSDDSSNFDFDDVFEGSDDFDDDPSWYWEEAWEEAEQWAFCEEDDDNIDELTYDRKRNRAWRRKNTFHHNQRKIRRLQNLGYYTREEDQSQVYDLVNGHFSGHCFNTYGAMCRKEAKKADIRREQRWIHEASLEELKDCHVDESFNWDVDFDNFGDDFSNDFDFEELLNLPVRQFLQMIREKDSVLSEQVLNRIMAMAN